MQQCTTNICLLDKSFPPDHSFVHGMLANAYPKATAHRVILLVSKGKSLARVNRYGRAICVPILRERQSFGRFWNFFLAVYIQSLLIFRYRKRRVNLFVRNDPIYLLAALLVRPFVSHLVFQSSFPHEDSHPRWTHRLFALLIYRLLIPLVDALVVVSPTAVLRIRRYSNKVPAYVIPLLNDGIVGSACTTPKLHDVHSNNNMLRICYLGAHSAYRQLEIVLAGCLNARRAGIPLEVVTVGATNREREGLLANPIVKKCFSAGFLSINTRRPREELSHFLSKANLGISLIPPHPQYHEASPTKLAEYFAAGIPVLASYGIPLQEDWILRSQAGWLAEFTESDIERALCDIWSQRHDWAKYSEAALRFSAEELSYDAYTSVLQSAFEPVAFPTSANKTSSSQHQREAA